MDWIRVLFAAVHAGLAAATGMIAPAAHPGPPARPRVPAGWYASAPYYRVLVPGAPDARTVMASTGQRAFTLAFILADGRRCAPAWKGTDPVSGDTRVAALIRRIRSGGGDVAVSAGGYGGTKLGQVCATAAATAAAYQEVIAAYRLYAFDFDLEDLEITNPDAIGRELLAAQILRRDNPGLDISVTIPGAVTGATRAGLTLLREARAIGLVPASYAIMPFDAHFHGGASQVAALTGFHGQLMRTFGWSSAQAYSHEGFSGMNGQTGDGEYFRPGDFRRVLAFARTAGLGRFTFWAVNRDRPCRPPGNRGRLSATCSGVAQRPWDFTAFTAAYAEGR